MPTSFIHATTAMLLLAVMTACGTEELVNWSACELVAIKTTEDINYQCDKNNKEAVMLKPVTHTQKLQTLYDCEINAEVAWFAEAGFTARLGDPDGGYDAQENFRTIEEAVDYLWQEARKYYPDAACFR